MSDKLLVVFILSSVCLWLIVQGVFRIADIINEKRKKK